MNSYLNQNPIVNRFTEYSAQNNSVPFSKNDLINRNVNISSNLNQNKKPNRNNMNLNNVKKTNIIDNILKPQKINKDNNKEVMMNYQINERERNPENIKKNYKMSNAPYKIIMKDKIVNKNVEDIKVEDIVVYKTNKKIDADINKFDTELNDKNNKLNMINEELKVEFDIDNYDKHKKKFEYKETFIRNLGFKQNTFNDSKSDYIEFYKKKQREAEEGKELCDKILREINSNSDIISKEELPE